MEPDVLTGLATIVVLGVGVQWLAHRIHVPALVLLLAAGVLAGELGLVAPQEILGDALYPLVSLAVGVLLFDAGLGLDLRRLGRGARAPVVRLVTVGVLLTWLAGAVTAGLVLGLSTDQALLLGAVVVVSGPTVVGPLLRVARPRDPARSVLHWEGVVVDPVGAALGIATLHTAFLAEHNDRDIGVQLVLTLLVGLAMGALAAALAVLLLRLLLVPDDLTVAVVIALVIATFAASEAVHGESGLLATTVMGVALANQRATDVAPIREFSETTGVFVIGSLFIVLAAQVDIEAVGAVLPETLLLAAVLVLLVRPLVAFVSTTRTRGLTWRDRAFVGMLAPRGVVAAATAATFSLELSQRGLRFPELVPVVYGLIIVLAVVYALSVPAARLIGVARPDPRGVALVGDRPWVLDLARALGTEGVPVLLVAPGRGDLAVRTDLPYDVASGPLHELAEAGVLDDLQAFCVAVEDPEREQVGLAVGVEAMGRSRTFVLPPTGRLLGKPLGATRAFGAVVTWEALEAAAASGSRVRATTEASPSTLPLVHVRANGTVDLAPRRTTVGGADRLLVLDPGPVSVPRPQPRKGQRPARGRRENPANPAPEP